MVVLKYFDTAQRLPSCKSLRTIQKQLGGLQVTHVGFVIANCGAVPPGSSSSNLLWSRNWVSRDTMNAT